MGGIGQDFISLSLSVKYPPVPVFGSKPHFLDTDPELTWDKVDNLPMPDRSRDDTVLYVHPVRMHAVAANTHLVSLCLWKLAVQVMHYRL